MARANKIIDADIQIDPFIEKLTGWLTQAIKRGSVSVTAITSDEEDFDTGKSSVQNARFHAMIGDINKTGVIVIPGRRIVMSDYDSDQCKALLVMWFAAEKEQLGEPLPKPPRSFIDPISGQSISIRPSTTTWGKKLTCQFTEFLYATGAMADVKWSEPALKAYAEYKEAQL